MLLSSFNTREFICGAVLILVLNMGHSLFFDQLPLLQQFVAMVTVNGPITVCHVTVGVEQPT